MDIEQEASRKVCRRQSAREPVSLAGSAFALSRSRSVIISDLSSRGAKLDGRDLPPAGDDLCLVMGSFDTMATVAWRADDKCGIQFDDPIPYKVIAQLKQSAEWLSVAGWYR